MEDTATLLQILETGGTIGTLIMFVVLFIRGDIQPKSTLEQMKATHEQSVALMHQIAMDAARETGTQIGKEISSTILHDVESMIDSKFMEYGQKRDNTRL